MYLKSLSLHNFRNYTQKVFSFDEKTTVIVGPNASGKTNLIESISLLSTGKSKKAERENQLIRFTATACQVKGKVVTDEGETMLEMLLADNGNTVQKKYLVNGVSKRRIDFAGNLLSVHFSPMDLDLVAGQPGNRRRYLDDVLEQTDFAYRTALATYTKALKQRNALLEGVQKTGVRNEKLFSFWDELLITHGNTITSKREALLTYFNQKEKTLFPFQFRYDHSLISQERLLQYKDAEVAVGATLVGPHRDDIEIETENNHERVDVRYFASRGQQRLITLEMKFMQLGYITEQMQEKPLLLLDDIFSELDETHIEKILSVLPNFQTIITTTHKELLPQAFQIVTMIELDQE